MHDSLYSLLDISKQRSLKVRITCLWIHHFFLPLVSVLEALLLLLIQESSLCLCLSPIMVLPLAFCTVISAQKPRVEPPLNCFTGHNENVLTTQELKEFQECKLDLFTCLQLSISNVAPILKISFLLTFLMGRESEILHSILLTSQEKEKLFSSLWLFQYCSWENRAQDCTFLLLCLCLFTGSFLDPEKK